MVEHVLVLHVMVLSNFQCDNGKYRKNNGDNPETYGYFRLVFGRSRALNEILTIRLKL